MATKRKFGWKHTVARVAGIALMTALTIALILVLAVAFLVWSGAIDRWAQRTIVTQMERVTGTRVELGKFHFMRMIATVTELILSVAGAIVDWCYKRNGGRKSSRRDKLMFLVALCLVAVFCAALTHSVPQARCSATLLFRLC